MKSCSLSLLGLSVFGFALSILITVIALNNTDHKMSSDNSEQTTDQNSNPEKGTESLGETSSQKEKDTKSDAAGGNGIFNKLRKWYDKDREVINTAINFFMAIATWLVIFIAVSQNKLAKEQFDFTVETERQNSKESEERLKRDIATSNAQIDALKEHVALLKKQFKIENAPLLVMGPVRKIAFYPGKAFAFEYSLINAGKYPTKLIKYKIAYFNSTSNATKDDIMKQFEKSFSTDLNDNFPNAYITDKPNYFQGGDDEIIITEEFFNAVKNGNQIWWWGVENFYENLIDGTKSKMTCIVYFSLNKETLAPDVVTFDIQNIPVK